MREAAYHDGFLAGQAMATEAFLDEETRLTSDLVEALADARVTNEAARRHVAASLAPMIEALVDGDRADPRRRRPRRRDRPPRRAGVPPRARRRGRGCVCAPELCDTVEAALRERGLAATLEEAPELLPREAQIFWDQGYDHLDLDACIAQVRACIASHLRTEGGERR